MIDTSKPGPANIKIGVRPATKLKVDRIAKANRWTLVETVDAMADAFVARPNLVGTQPIGSNDARTGVQPE